MEYKYTSKNITETVRLAENIESEKWENMVICLNGELGSGKTVFTKGFAQAMAIKETITSPTFNIIKEYPEGELPLYHMDVYRLEENDDTIDFDEYFNKGGVTIIEWAEIIQDKLPKERLEITFNIIDENTRVLVFKAYGEKYDELCQAVL
jgi:tRNA threonylcarbamoyladenosine biosynthesis protein TsaE